MTMANPVDDALNNTFDGRPDDRFWGRPRIAYLAMPGNSF